MFFNMPCFCTHTLFWNVFPPHFLKWLLPLFQSAVQNIASSGKSSLSLQSSWSHCPLSRVYTVFAYLGSYWFLVICLLFLTAR